MQDPAVADSSGRAARLLRRLLAREPGPAGAPRVLVVAAHPDDETVGAGALLARLADPWVLHVTDGTPRDRRFRAHGFAGSGAEYARLRRREAAAALGLAGLGPERLRVLGVADQEAAAGMGRLAVALAALCQEIGPDLVLTHAYEGGHPDHDAVAFAVHAAAELLHASGTEPPAVAEMALYHAEEGRLVSARFLAPPDPSGSPALEVELSPAERERKRRMLGCFATQEETLRLVAAIAVESFRPAPAYDFTRPPHAGALQYEIWGFPLDGARWCRLVRRALAEIGLPEEAPL